jgi:hypothetical protein
VGRLTSEEKAYMKAHTAVGAMSPAHLRQQETKGTMRDLSRDLSRGTINAEMVCPHCQVRGQVRTRSKAMKKGISGGKATAAIFTAGISLLATGLASKSRVVQANCGNCHMVWTIE